MEKMILKIGILGAMPEEIDNIQEMMTSIRKIKIAEREYIEGYINNIQVIVVFSRWGKVAAAITATTLINHFKADLLIFTGVAGGVNDKLNIGDIVIGNGFYQHDMDARPFFDQFQIPLTDKIVYKPDNCNIKIIKKTTSTFVNNILNFINRKTLTNFSINNIPNIYLGLIASGDKFVTTQNNNLFLHGTLCVEMEGASVAQVCTEHNIPYVIIRIISDKANHDAVFDFQNFITNIACQFTQGIIYEYFKEINSI